MPSQKVATYDLAPEMSAPGITDVLCAAIDGEGARFHALQLRERATWSGTPGSLPATIKAVETVDAVPRARGRGRRAGGRAAARHGGPRQLRDDDRSGDRRPAHRAHDESGAVRRRGRRRRPATARWRRAVRRRPDDPADARARAAPPRWTDATCVARDRVTQCTFPEQPREGILVRSARAARRVPGAAHRWVTAGTSPYADLEYRQELTPFGGYARARVDPAGVLPQSASIAGLRYELYLAGPVSFTQRRVTRMFSDRTVIDPDEAGSASRFVGTESAPVYAARPRARARAHGPEELAQPRAAGPRGRRRRRTASAADDTTGYKFGTPFAFTFGGGVKFVPGGRLQLRADVAERLFKQKYPDSYYRTASDNTAVLTDALAVVLDAPRPAHGRRLVPVRPLSRRAAGDTSSRR